MGFVDAAFFSPETPRILVDGRRAPMRWDRYSGRGSLTLSAQAACTLRMEKE
jgi:hypothetical protein